MTALLEAPGLSDDIAEIAKSCLPSPIFVEAGLLVLMEEGLLPCNKLNQGIPLPVLQPTSTTRTETLEPKLDSNVIEAQETAISSQESKEMVTLNARKTHINIVVIGHANSGKSTMTGNLLFKLGEIDKLVMDGIEREAIDMNMQPSKYAWVLNKLKAERQKAITIDITAMKFETPKYCCTIIDAPGHREFIKNMITGTSQADCAVLIIDSMIGSFEAGMSIDGQTREHALLAFTLGVKQMICCCNKVDLTTPIYSEARHNEIVTEVSAYLKKVGFKPETIPFIPTSGWDGDNLIDRSPNTNWYTGPTLFEAFDQIMEEPKRLSDQPLRLPLGGAYHIGGVGTVAAGCVAMGTVTSDMLVEIGPTCMRRMVTSVEMEAGKKPLLEALPGDNITLTFDAAAVATTDLLPGYVVSDPKHPAMEADSFTSHVIIMNQPGKN